MAENIIIDKQTGPAGPGLFHTSDYASNSACIQAALNDSKSGDTIIIREGDYFLPKEVNQTGKSLNILGEGKVTLHMLTPDRGTNQIAGDHPNLKDGVWFGRPPRTLGT